MTSEHTQVFIAYHHQDREWLKRLQVHLKPLEREGLIERWDDTQIQPGTVWREEIQRTLAATRVAVLLISADFLFSDFIVEKILPTLLTAAEVKQVRILPLILKPCTLPPELARFQTVNHPEGPLAGLSPEAQEALLVKVTQAIQRTLESPVETTPVETVSVSDDASAPMANQRSPLEQTQGFGHRLGHSLPQDSMSAAPSGKEQRLRQRIHELQQDWDRHSEKLTRLKEQYILESREEEKFRLEPLIEKTESERKQVEQQLQDLEDQLYGLGKDTQGVAGRNGDRGQTQESQAPGSPSAKLEKEIVSGTGESTNFESDHLRAESAADSEDLTTPTKARNGIASYISRYGFRLRSAAWLLAAILVASAVAGLSWQWLHPALSFTEEPVVWAAAPVKLRLDGTTQYGEFYVLPKGEPLPADHAFKIVYGANGPHHVYIFTRKSNGSWDMLERGQGK